jgi:cytidylate kinase
MTQRFFVLTIDGPAASGKSSTARRVAYKLGFSHVDSGSLYRAATAAQLETGTSAESWTEDALVEAAKRVSLAPRNGLFSPLLDGEGIEERLHGVDVTRHVSRVAQMQRVRAWVNTQVQATSTSRSIVVDGRDMGTVVFPNADLKIFLVADPWERARRRLRQRLDREPTDPEIAEETDLIVHRDAKDATQTVQATDAVLIDTTLLTQTDQVDRIVALAMAVSHRPSGTSEVDV